MALEDLIANSGARNFETFRRGWLPTQGERQARSLRDLDIQKAKSEMAYEPTKRRLKEKSSEMNIRYQESLIKKHDRDSSRFKAEADKKLYIENQETMGRHFQSANKLKTVEQQKTYLRRYKKELLAAGDDEEDAAFEAVLHMNGDQFKESFGLAVQGNKYIQGLNEKRFGKTTTLQNFETGVVKTVKYNDIDYQMKVDGALSEGFNVIKTPGLEQTGTPESLGLTDKKLNRELVNEQSAIETANFIGGRTIDLLTKSPEALGLSGSFARMATSLKSQIDSAAKLAGTSWKPDTSFEPDSYRKIFQDAGIDNVILKGNLTQLARMMATSSGEGKVLSDKDMKRWLEVVAVNNGDPKTVASAIRNALDIQNFRFRQKYRNVKGSDYEGDLFYPKEVGAVDVTQRQSEITARLAKIKKLKEQRK